LSVVDDDSLRETVIRRLAARVVLIDSTGRTLLFRGGDPSRPEAGTWWFTPGGGVEDGETLPEAARREVLEETGVDLVEVGEPVVRRRIRYRFEGELIDQTEHIFVARADITELNASGWTEVERRVVVEHRWWSLAELHSTRERVYPDTLAELLADALNSP
jgi:8-oxo-dGTP pyrophosphatase MutT (NUDIX family)